MTASEIAFSSTRQSTGSLPVYVQRRVSDGSWVLTPLAKAPRIEIVEGDISGRGCLWTLDERVFVDSRSIVKPSMVKKIIKKQKRHDKFRRDIESVTKKLELQRSLFEEQRAAAVEEQQRLNEQHLEIRRLRAELQEETQRLALQSANLRRETSDVSFQIAKAMNTSIVGRGCAAFPPQAFFSAALGNFGWAVPALSNKDLEELRHVRISPDKAFAEAKKTFDELAKRGQRRVDRRRVDAWVSALFAVESLETSSDSANMKEQRSKVLRDLSGMSGDLARQAASAKRPSLAFVASTCAVWCAMRLVEHIGRGLDAANPKKLLQDVEAQASCLKGSARHLEQLAKQATGFKGSVKQLAQQAALAHRLLKAWQEHHEHRRRFIRDLATHGSTASEGDLRLLLMTPDVPGTELAAHMQRTSQDLVADDVVAVADA